jgi:hypothetical protein
MKMVIFGNVMDGNTGCIGCTGWGVMQHCWCGLFSQHSCLLLLLQQSCCGQQFSQHGPSQLVHAIFWHWQELGFEQHEWQHALDLEHVLQLTDGHWHLVCWQQELQHALELVHESQFIEVHLDSGHPVATTVFGHRLLRQPEYDL